jgi:hypothetical protein
MPAIIEYAAVLQRMTAEGFVCNYPNSGAFGFASHVEPLIRGWIGPPDATIKPGLLPMVKPFPPPWEANLAAAFVHLWQSALPGEVWLMPASHWHFEFHDGSRDWLADAMRAAQVDPAILYDRADGSAVAFAISEIPLLEPLLRQLLEHLTVSDFMLAFPGQAVLCLVHHHKQLWWMSTDAAFMEQAR